MLFDYRNDHLPMIVRNNATNNESTYSIIQNYILQQRLSKAVLRLVSLNDICIPNRLPTVGDCTSLLYHAGGVVSGVEAEDHEVQQDQKDLEDCKGQNAIGEWSVNTHKMSEK